MSDDLEHVTPDAVIDPHGHEVGEQECDLPCELRISVDTTTGRIRRVTVR